MAKAIRAAALAALATTLAGAAAADGLPRAERTAAAAIERGHGGQCSLDLRLAASGGYWACADFGPYRFVQAYGRSHFAVVQEGRDPFVVASGTPGNLQWLHDGPWTSDLPDRVSAWWTDVVEGAAAARQREEARSEAARAASEYIRSLAGNGGEEQDPQPAPPSLPPPTAEQMTPDAREILSRGG